MGNLLVIEDEAVLAKNIKRALEKLGHTVAIAATGAEGERLFAEIEPDLTLLDLRLPDSGGLELLPRLRAKNDNANVIVMTAFASVEDAVQAIKLGARDYLQKPMHLDDLRHAVTRALEEAQLHREVSYYREKESRGAALDGLLGRCPSIDELRAKINRLCSLPANANPPTVLIVGETGSGKGLLARVLHYNGQRAGKPFIEVNCAAIPDNLVEAELFGYERGAFTDAKTSKEGLFQAADGGSLFLDEIGCLGLALQVKILKAIEDKTVRPLGGRAERKVDIQIIAATNADLEAMVAAGTFREDLYYRLRVASLRVPPLRERGDDALLLAEKFIADISRSYRIPPRPLSDAAKQLIRSYRWPGNVRELRNTLENVVLFAEGDEIDAPAFGLPQATTAASLQVRGDSGFQIEIPDEGLRFEELERALIVSALSKAEGSQSGAARLLGMSRDTLRYRMEKFQIE
jgi:DNA-binding NtrC family response regulator